MVHYIAIAQYIVCCGIYVAQRDSSIVAVKGHVSAVDVRYKGYEYIATNDYIIIVDIEVDYV